MKASIYAMDKRVDLATGKSRGDTLYPCRFDINEGTLQYLEVVAGSALDLLYDGDYVAYLNAQKHIHDTPEGYERATHAIITNFPSPIRDEYRGGVSIPFGSALKFSANSPIPEPAPLSVRMVRNDTMYHDDQSHLPYLMDIGYWDVEKGNKWVSLLPGSGYLSFYHEYQMQLAQASEPKDMRDMTFTSYEFAREFIVPRDDPAFAAWDLVLPGHGGFVMTTVTDIADYILRKYKYDRGAEIFAQYPARKEYVQDLWNFWAYPIEGNTLNQEFERMKALVKTELQLQKEGAVIKEGPGLPHKER